MAGSGTTGERLRVKMDAALVATGVAGAEWSEAEQEALDAACEAADRAEQLRQVFAAELAGQARPTTLSRLSAEARHCERQAVNLIGQLQLEPVPPKSARHQRAVRARWGSAGP